MDAPRSAGAPVSSPAAAQRCAEGAGLDSGVLAAAQSAMLSIAAAAAMIADMISTRAAAFDDPSATARIYTRLTDVTNASGTPFALRAKTKPKDAKAGPSFVRQGNKRRIPTVTG